MERPVPRAAGGRPVLLPAGRLHAVAPSHPWTAGLCVESRSTRPSGLRAQRVQGNRREEGQRRFAVASVDRGLAPRQPRGRGTAFRVRADWRRRRHVAQDRGPQAAHLRLPSQPLATAGDDGAHAIPRGARQRRADRGPHLLLGGKDASAAHRGPARHGDDADRPGFVRSAHHPADAEHPRLELPSAGFPAAANPAAPSRRDQAIVAAGVSQVPHAVAAAAHLRDRGGQAPGQHAGDGSAHALCALRRRRATPPSRAPHPRLQRERHHVRAYQRAPEPRGGAVEQRARRLDRGPAHQRGNAHRDPAMVVRRRGAGGHPRRHRIHPARDFQAESRRCRPLHGCGHAEHDSAEGAGARRRVLRRAQGFSRIAGPRGALASRSGGPVHPDQRASRRRHEIRAALYPGLDLRVSREGLALARRADPRPVPVLPSLSSERAGPRESPMRLEEHRVRRHAPPPRRTVRPRFLPRQHEPRGPRRHRRLLRPAEPRNGVPGNAPREGSRHHRPRRPQCLCQPQDARHPLDFPHAHHSWRSQWHGGREDTGLHRQLLQLERGSWHSAGAQARGAGDIPDGGTPGHVHRQARRDRADLRLHHPLPRSRRSGARAGYHRSLACRASLDRAEPGHTPAGGQAHLERRDRSQVRRCSARRMRGGQAASRPLRAGEGRLGPPCEEQHVHLQCRLRQRRLAVAAGHGQPGFFRRGGISPLARTRPAAVAHRVERRAAGDVAGIAGSDHAQLRRSTGLGGAHSAACSRRSQHRKWNPAAGLRGGHRGHEGARVGRRCGKRDRPRAANQARDPLRARVHRDAAEAHGRRNTACPGADLCRELPIPRWLARCAARMDEL